MILKRKTFKQVVDWDHKYGNHTKHIITAEYQFNEWCKDKPDIIVLSVDTNIDKEGYSIITMYY